MWDLLERNFLKKLYTNSSMVFEPLCSSDTNKILWKFSLVKMPLNYALGYQGESVMKVHTNINKGK